jgi:tetratricopeptide (TPR) repeat protein
MVRDRVADLERLRAIHALAVSGDVARAAQQASEALADGIEHPFLLNLAATQLEDAGDLTGALALLERAVALAPDDVGALNALGLCLRRLDRPRDALPPLARVVALIPHEAFAHASLGDVMLMVGRLADADACYAAALERDPRQPVALAGRASVARLRGDSVTAARFGAKALEVMPGLPAATLAVAAGELADGQHETAALRLRALIAAGLMPLDRADALNLLGDVLDAALQPHLAFVAYQECNDLLREHYASAYVGPLSASAYARTMLETIQSTPAAPSASPANETMSSVPMHVFLVGFPRSGTTLLELILDGHPDVVTSQEGEFLLEASVAYLSNPADLTPLQAATDEELVPYRDAYWRAARAEGITVKGRVFVDKYPLNILKLPLIARLFPHARVLLARRDPRDVVLSSFRRRFHMSAPFFELLTLEGAARYYDLVMQLERAFARHYPLPTHVVEHERLLDSFEDEMRRVCDFLAIDWTPKMGEFAERARQRRTATPSTAQLSAGLNRKGLGHWRRYAEEMNPVTAQLAPWVRAFGYD